MIHLSDKHNEQLIPVIPIRDGIVFPHTESILTFGRPKSLAALESAFNGERVVCFVLQKNPKLNEPEPADLYSVGTVSHIERMIRTDGEVNALVKGLSRAKIVSYDEAAGYFLARIVESEIYKAKKNELFEEKIKLQEKIAVLEERGSASLEPLREFIEVASSCEKIARAKNNCDDLANIAKRVGSNFYLYNRQLSPVLKKAFDTVRAVGDARTLSDPEKLNSLQVGIRRIEMVIDKGELSWFHHLDESGPSKVWVGMAYVDDQLIYNFQRINEEEETIGGTMAVHLPVRPEIINIGTLPTYDRHLNTVADWQEEERWVREGQVVKPGYMIECYRRAMEKLLGIKAQKAS